MLIYTKHKCYLHGYYRLRSDALWLLKHLGSCRCSFCRALREIQGRHQTLSIHPECVSMQKYAKWNKTKTPMSTWYRKEHEYAEHVCLLERKTMKNTINVPKPWQNNRCSKWVTGDCCVSLAKSEVKKWTDTCCWLRLSKVVTVRLYSRSTAQDGNHRYDQSTTKQLSKIATDARLAIQT